MRLLRTQLKQYAEEQPKASSVVKTTALAASVDDSSSKFVSSFKPGGGQGALTASAAIVTTDTSACAPRLSHPPAGAGSADTGGDSDVEWVDGYESLQSKSLVGGSSSSSSSLRREQYQHQHQQEDQLQWQLPENSADLSPEVLAALPAHIRKSLVEEARRRQRMESRAHYLPVAGNPALYSQTQLSNFLNSRYVQYVHTVAFTFYATFFMFILFQ